MRIKPFARYGRHISVVLSRGRYGDWSLNLLAGIRKPPFNKGAGYRGGFTAFVAWRCVDQSNMYVPCRGLAVGITRNAHRVPWTRS